MLCEQREGFFSTSPFHLDRGACCCQLIFPAVCRDMTLVQASSAACMLRLLLHNHEWCHVPCGMQVGSVNNTFGIKGVQEYCQFFKSIEDANNLRRRISECFERAALPYVSARPTNNMTQPVAASSPHKQALLFTFSPVECTWCLNTIFGLSVVHMQNLKAVDPCPPADYGGGAQEAAVFCHLWWRSHRC